MHEYHTAKKTFIAHQNTLKAHEETFREIQARWHTRLERLNAIFEPGLDKVEDHIGTFTAEYLHNTQKNKVWQDTRDATGMRINPIMFGRLMSSYGYSITTRKQVGPRGVKMPLARHWRYRD